VAEQGIPGWIKQQLQRRDWTAADLARRTGVGTGRISEWMSGHRRPNPASCIVLADAFGADPDDVLVIAGYRAAPESFDPDDPRRQIISLLRRVHLTPDRARTLEAILETYLETDRGT
jgi:transcriptional regulator with XRE-family HTH domain